MPIYEFYCPVCNMIFSFFSRGINTKKIPPCPKCGFQKMVRQASVFSSPSTQVLDGEDVLPYVDESRLERAMQHLLDTSACLNKDAPDQAAKMLRAMINEAGLGLGPGMEEVVGRIQAGEDPEAVEADMGEALHEDEALLVLTALRSGGRSSPCRDETLYDL